MEKNVYVFKGTDIRISTVFLTVQFLFCKFHKFFNMRIMLNGNTTHVSLYCIMDPVCAHVCMRNVCYNTCVLNLEQNSQIKISKVLPVLFYFESCQLIAVSTFF